MANKPKDSRVDKSIIRDALEYNYKTGDLIWKKRPRFHFKTRTAMNNFNKRWAGSLIRNIGNDGYYRLSIDHHRYKAHRIIWFLHYGSFPSQYIDHLDGNKLNNKIDNLRDVTIQENAKNTKINVKSKTKIMGVGWHKMSKKWRARIKHTCNGEKKEHYLGVFDNFFDACCARKSAENKYGFHKNHGRSQ